MPIAVVAAVAEAEVTLEEGVTVAVGLRVVVGEILVDGRSAFSSYCGSKSGVVVQEETI